MPTKSLNQVVTETIGKIPLRVVLVLPFVVQILATVGTISYLTTRNGQRAIDTLADQLMVEVSRRIEQNLQAYVTTPSLINRNNYNIIQLQMLSLQNLSAWEPYLLNQIQTYHSTVLYVGIGNIKGEYRSAEQLSENSLRLNFAQDSLGFRSYSVNQLGQRLALKETIPSFRLRQRQEYQSIVQAKHPIWTPIFASLLQPTLLIAKADPVIDQKQQFQGFVITALRLDGIGQFLSHLEVSQTGQAFVINRQGQLLATSTSEQPFIDRHGARHLIQAIDSRNALTQATARYLTQAGKPLTGIQSIEKMKISFGDRTYYLSILPFQSDSALDWLIVVAIPETDFIGEIAKNHQLTLLLSLISVLISIGLSIIAARWVIKPLLELNEAAKQIASGDWQQAIKIQRHDEVGQLADSFNRMSQQLKRSFDRMKSLNQELTASKNQLAQANQSLERQIKERTEALERANRELVRLATTDSLTQLANRRRFDDYLYQQWVHSIRSRSHLSLILCDVDYFKRYNDYYGHQMGDECLQQVSHAIRSALQRTTDLAARYGGEEFGIILPYSDLAGATLVARAIQAQIQHLQRPHARSDVSPYITISLGIAHVLPQRSLSFEKLIACADAALYEAKTQGRNCYCVRELTLSSDHS